jgi:hypothetical protein
VNRIACSFVVVAVALAPAVRAWADDAPKKEQLEAAKKAYGEGKQLHDAGKLGEAVEKFKESYRLSKNALLLYNIALTLDENKQTDSALFYYRKFLSDSPADAAQRPPAEERVKVLENEKLAAEMSDKGGDKGDAAATPDKTEAPAKPTKGVPFDVTTFQHTVVEDAPPGKPIDVAATIPESSSVSVILYYRTAGSAEFTAKPMKWHGKDLVARIPASATTGSAIQYYIEVKDSSGAKLTSSGKPTDPNLINLDASAQEHTYADFVDDVPVKEPAKHHDDDNPLKGGDENPSVSASTTTDTGPTGDGMFDVGSTKFKYTKWSATGGAVVLLGLGVMFDVMAGQQASALVSDSMRTTCTPHCTFDDYDQQLQSAGQRDELLSRITIGVGIASAAVAGYFWYRQLSGHPTATEPKVVVTPSIGQNFHGAAAAVRF